MNTPNQSTGAEKRPMTPGEAIMATVGFVGTLLFLLLKFLYVVAICFGPVVSLLFIARFYYKKLDNYSISQSQKNTLVRISFLPVAFLILGAFATCQDLLHVKGVFSLEDVIARSHNSDTLQGYLITLGFVSSISAWYLFRKFKKMLKEPKAKEEQKAKKYFILVDIFKTIISNIKKALEDSKKEKEQEQSKNKEEKEETEAEEKEWERRQQEKRKEKAKEQRREEPKQEQKEETEERWKTKDPFKILGVSPSASSSEIKKAYYSLLAQYHPDKVAMLAPEFKKIAEEKSKLLNTAYDSCTRNKAA